MQPFILYRGTFPRYNILLELRWLKLSNRASMYYQETDRDRVCRLVCPACPVCPCVYGPIFVTLCTFCVCINIVHEQSCRTAPRVAVFPQRNKLDYLNLNTDVHWSENWVLARSHPTFRKFAENH